MAPRVFVSYSWDSAVHRRWVQDFATRLRDDGVDATIDKWATVPGDQLPAFMERAVRESDYVLIICTPGYKKRSDERKGGVGYEGDIMTGEVMNTGHHRKFIPVLREGQWSDAAASWLASKIYVDLRGNPYLEDTYNDLLDTIFGTRAAPPPLGTRSPRATSPLAKGAVAPISSAAAAEGMNPTRLHEIWTALSNCLLNLKAGSGQFVPVRTLWHRLAFEGFVGGQEVTKALNSAIETKRLTYREKGPMLGSVAFTDAGYEEAHMR